MVLTEKRNAFHAEKRLNLLLIPSKRENNDLTIIANTHRDRHTALLNVSTRVNRNADNIVVTKNNLSRDNREQSIVNIR